VVAVVVVVVVVEGGGESEATKAHVIVTVNAFFCCGPRRRLTDSVFKTVVAAQVGVVQIPVWTHLIKQLAIVLPFFLFLQFFSTSAAKT